MNVLLSILKTYRTPIISLLVSIGLITTIFFIDNNPLSIVCFVIGLIGFVVTGALFSKIIDEKIENQNPYFFDDLITESWQEKFIKYGSYAIFLLGFLSAEFSRIWWTNILKEDLFLIIWVIIGILLASAILYILYKWKPHFFISNETRFDQWATLWFGIICFTISIGAFMTFYIPGQSQYSEAVKIIEYGGESREEKPIVSIKVIHKGEKLELRPNSKNWRSLEKSDSAILIITQSPLGFEYVCEIQPK